MSSPPAEEGHTPVYSSSGFEDSAFTKVSPEIWCEIMENVHAVRVPLAFAPGSSQKDLVSCSLSCRQLVYPSQSMLFKTLFLNSNKKVTSILRSLSHAPHLARHIRQLVIVHGSHGISWSGDKDEIMALQALCTGVVQLYVHPGHRFENLSNSTLPDGVTANTRICQTGLLFRSLPSVHTIQVTMRSSEQATALPKFLNGYIGLRTLIVVNFRDKGPSGGYEVGPQFSLQNLVLYSSSITDKDFLLWLIPALKELKHLDIKGNMAFTWENWNYAMQGKTIPFIDISFRDWIRRIGGPVTDLRINMADSGQGKCDNYYDAHNKDIATDRKQISGLNELLSLLEYTPRVQKLTIGRLSMFKTSPMSFNRIIEVSTQRRLASLSLNFFVETSDDKYSDTQAAEDLWRDFQSTLKEQRWGPLTYEINLDFTFVCKNRDIPAHFREIYVTLEERLFEILQPFSSRRLLRISRGRSFF
ncbi:hypothetical protein CVT25_004225 [Psilocybe cyanescens]|uniref:Uncharacterized protein n=1 Tax=Psilocybe cyanescens TaxID=93625 RepID=A0A409X2Z3_PSICY|nr:hypothetical protein CVT25_004225 [Psilocybe cyanescens]